MIDDERLNIKIAWVLRTSVVIAFILTTLGYIFLLWYSHIPQIKGLKEFMPLHWHAHAMLAAFGLLFFVLVPLFRVMYAAFYFFKHRDFIFTFLSLWVLFMVTMGVIIGITAGHAAG